MVSKIFRNDDRISFNSREMEQRMKTLTNQRDKLKDLCKKYAQVSAFSSCSKSSHLPIHSVFKLFGKLGSLFFLGLLLLPIIFSTCPFQRSYTKLKQIAVIHVKLQK